MGFVNKDSSLEWKLMQNEATCFVTIVSLPSLGGRYSLPRYHRIRGCSCILSVLVLVFSQQGSASPPPAGRLARSGLVDEELVDLVVAGGSLVASKMGPAHRHAAPAASGRIAAAAPTETAPAAARRAVAHTRRCSGGGAGAGTR
jgi:hypothetical protein